MVNTIIKSEFRRTYKTPQHLDVEVFYDEDSNLWRFELNGRMRSKDSLLGAKTSIESFIPQDKRVKMSKVKFKPFEILKLNWGNSYRSNMEDVKINTVAFLGVEESRLGSEVFDQAKVSSSSGTEKLGIDNSKQETLYYKNDNNVKLVEQFNSTRNKFMEEKQLIFNKIQEIQLEENKLSKQIDRIEERFRPEVNKLKSSLENIQMMDEFEWQMLGMRMNNNEEEEEKVDA